MRGAGLVLGRRFLTVSALAFWVGGFTFYAGVVVPVGTAVLGGPQEQGAITRQVTVYLNLTAAVALAWLAAEVAATRGGGNVRWGRWATWAGMAALLGVLVWLRGWLDARMDPDTGEIVGRREFLTAHRWYLWLSTLQWALALAHIALTLAAWRREDRAE